MIQRDTTRKDILRLPGRGGTISYVEDTEATQLTLETLFHIKVAVDEIHAAVVEPEDDDEETEEDT